MARHDEAHKLNAERVTVRLNEVQQRRLGAVCAASSKRAKLTKADVIRTLIDDLEAPGFSPAGATHELLSEDTSPCERVHLDDATAHKLLVELGREGRNLMMIARKMNQSGPVMSFQIAGQFEELLTLWRELKQELGSSEA